MTAAAESSSGPTSQGQPSSADPDERRNVRAFGAIWVGQLVSIIGSALTTFVLGVWVFLETGSVTQFAMISFATVLPAMISSPLAGVFADRADRRWLMVWANVGSTVPAAAILVLVSSDQLAVWHVYPATAIAAMCNTVHQVSFQAMIPKLVPKRHLGRVNGLMQTVQAVQIAAPVVAGVLITTIGLRGVLVIDVISFGFAVGTLLLIRLPADVTRVAGQPASRPSMWRDAGAGFGYLRARAGLVWLLVVFGVFNFFFAMAGVLIQPLILSFSTPAMLGVLKFVGGGGLFVGGLVMSAWGGPARKINGVYLALVLGGVFLMLHSLRPSALLIAVVAPAFLFQLPMMNACAITILQTKVPGEVLGRVLAATRLVGMSTAPIAYLLAGPAADTAESLMRPDGALAGTVGRLIGVGEGRGIALIFCVVGICVLALAMVAMRQPRLRELEDEIPDAIGDSPTADTTRAGADAADPAGDEVGEPSEVPAR